jgi:hypothetical protein
LGRNRCPNCGKRVPEYEPCCPRCGHSIPLAFGDPGDRIDPTLDDDDEWRDDGYEGIDDPELLERAEASVRALPLKDLAGLAGTYKYTPVPDFTKARTRITADEDTDEDTDGHEVAAAEGDVVEETSDPAPLGGECPVCGRQAQKGWKTCPWCGSSLPAPHCGRASAADATVPL